MRKVLFAVFLVVALFSVISHARPHTLIPWPYGMMVLVQTPSIDQQQFIDDATQAVNDVFSFWDLPVPVPDQDWASPTQTDSQALWSMRMQNPELLLAEDENPFLSPMQLAFGTTLPGDDPEHELVVPFPVWSGWKIMPLTIGVFPSVESINRLLEDCTFSAFLGSVARYTMFRFEDSWSEDEQDLLALLWDTATINMSSEGDTRHILSHELSHWASCLWCQDNGTDLFTLPRLIIEGFADYTANSLMHDHTCRVIAAAWAQKGGDLESVPWPLTYEVGTSIVNLLVQQKGKDGLLEMLADPAVNWEKVISSLIPGDAVVREFIGGSTIEIPHNE